MDKKFKEDFLKGSAAASIGQASSMVFHFISIMILARYMPVDDFGMYMLIIAISYLFNTLGSLGLEVTLVKFISSDDVEVKKNVFLPVMVLKLVFTSLTAGIFYLISGLILPLFGEWLGPFAFLIIILFFLGSFRDVFYNLFQGLGYFRVYASIQVFSAFLRVLMIVLFIFAKKINLQNIIYIEVIVTVLTIIMHLLKIPYKKVLHYVPGLGIYRSIMKFSMPVFLNNIFTIMYGRVNLFIIGIYLSPASVALFDVASKIPEALKKMFNAFILVYFPNLSKLLSRGAKSEAQKLMNTSLSAFSIAISSLVFFVFLYRNELTNLVFSNKYMESAVAFALLMLNFHLNAVASIMGYSILSSGHPEIPMRVNIVSSVISVGGGLLMIPRLGFMGAVYALLVMNAVAQIFYFLYLKKIALVADSGAIFKPLLLLIVIGAIYFLFQSDSQILKILFLFLFAALNFLLIKEIKIFFMTLLKHFSVVRLKNG